ncbi:hypothetical protein R5R35_007847 [Gryllus longicercus]|uniref:Uncharacterized protein n=1 Tax=Gryllus longicercus TaxID=2509291 RepID=A0AAN9V3Z6_9ORTH
MRRYGDTTAAARRTWSLRRRKGERSARAARGRRRGGARAGRGGVEWGGEDTLASEATLISLGSRSHLPALLWMLLQDPRCQRRCRRPPAGAPRSPAPPPAARRRSAERTPRAHPARLPIQHETSVKN